MHLIAFFFFNAFLGLTVQSTRLRQSENIQNPDVPGPNATVVLPNATNSEEAPNDQAHWVVDVNQPLKVYSNRIICQANDTFPRVYNAIWKESHGMSNGTHFWLYHFKDSNVFAGVGLTSEKYYRPDHTVRGLIYDGNLIGGYRTLVRSFGPKIEKGDVIGILLIYDTDYAKIYLYHNGLLLGLAFEVPSIDMKNIYPIVLFGAQGEVLLQKSVDIPSDRHREIVGRWILTHATILSHDETHVKDIPAFNCDIKLLSPQKYEFTCPSSNLSAKIEYNGKRFRITSLSRHELGVNELVISNLGKRLWNILSFFEGLNVDKAGQLHIEGLSDKVIFRRHEYYRGSFPPSGNL